MQGFGGGSPHYYVYKDYGLPTYMMMTRTFDILVTFFESEKTFFFLHLDFIATEFSQMETNRFFWIISDDPNLGDEPKKNNLRGLCPF
ncbi:MAG: hypothetical protein WC379_13610 [Methanoregula sp.]|jgi:hypothetical protein